MGETLLKTLCRERGILPFARFRTVYRHRARQLGYPDEDVSERTLDRWLNGRSNGARNAAAHILLEEFGHPVERLFAPPGANNGAGMAALHGGLDARALREAFLAIAREARHREWAEIIDDLRRSAYLVHEAQAASIRIFQPLVIPGPLQTEGYARAIFEAVRPTLDLAEVERRVAERLARARLLTGEAPPHYCAIVDEPVLHRPVGGRRVQRAQLEHLARVAQLGHVEVLVLSSDLGAYPAMEGPFQLFDFHETSDPALVYLGAVSDATYVQRPETVAAHRVCFDHLRAQALDRNASLALIERTASDLKE